jgi:hypothetical protein
VEASFGGGVATSLATIRLSPQSGQDEQVRKALVTTLQELASKPGLTGGHFLITDTPKIAVPTTEQQIRGSDAAADWIVLLSGYDSGIVQDTVSTVFSSAALHRLGARETSEIGRYALAFTMTAGDVATTT